MFTIEIKPEYLEKMDIIRELTGKPVTWQVNEAIEEYLQKSKVVL